MMVHERRSCPHCHRNQTGRHGSFQRKDGTRLPRWLCRSCGKTFSPNTGTSLYYIKKHYLWGKLAPAMAKRLSVRRAAGAIGVRTTTAFRWRHRVLAELSRAQPPALTGSVAVCEAYVRYSEKGSRRTSGPGAWGCRRAPVIGKHRFRRFIDGKPSCVLLACAEAAWGLLVVGQGRPQPAELEVAFKALLRSPLQLWGDGFAPYAVVCQRLRIPYRDLAYCQGTGERSHQSQAVHRLHGRLHSWLGRFHGVATRYLRHYLAWFYVNPGVISLKPAA